MRLIVPLPDPDGPSIVSTGIGFSALAVMVLCAGKARDSSRPVAAPVALPAQLMALG